MLGVVVPTLSPCAQSPTVTFSDGRKKLSTVRTLGAAGGGPLMSVRHCPDPLMLCSCAVARHAPVVAPRRPLSYTSLVPKLPYHTVLNSI